MEIKTTSLIGPLVAQSIVHADDRGEFMEWFKLKELVAATGKEINFTQGNLSRSHANVLRGIHYSTSPLGQSKWVTCIKGRILDFIIDLREESPTFKQWEEIEIKGMQGVAVYIPQGFGHAFLSLEDDSVVTYLVSSDFDPLAEKSINPFDQEISLKLPTKSPLVSEKDSNAPTLNEQLENGMLPKENRI